MEHVTALDAVLNTLHTACAASPAAGSEHRALREAASLLEQQAPLEERDPRVLREALRRAADQVRAASAEGSVELSVTVETARRQMTAAFFELDMEIDHRFGSANRSSRA